MKILQSLRKVLPLRKLFSRKVITVLGLICGLVFALYIIGCQDVEFSSLPNFTCDEEMGVEGVSCLSPQDLADLDGFPDPTEVSAGAGRRAGYTPPTRITTRLGRVNILFVIDFSSSMDAELRSIGKQFDSFLSEIKRADYQIAIISANEADQGQFFTFDDGTNMLSKTDYSARIHNKNVDLFKAALLEKRRSEDDSSDERAIYVLNQALARAENAAFFRPHSLLLVIIVSDEDERSYGGHIPKGVYDMHNRVRPLESKDYPETFFRAVSIQQKFSTVAVHSIIVPPKDDACEQESGGVKGRIYAEASRPSRSVLKRYGNIVKGHIGSICSKNYSDQLGSIAHQLQAVPAIPLPCVPNQRAVRVKIENKDADFRLEGRTIVIEEDVSFGDKARILFYCQTSPSQPTI